MSNSYIIENTAGTITFVIEPGALDGPGGLNRNSDLFLYGQGSTQWGEGVTENLIRIAESSACPEKEPTDTGYVAGNPRPKDQVDLGSIVLGITTPLNGQLWYNTTQKVMYTYDITNDEWRTGSGFYIDTDPLNPIVGDLKYDSNFHGAGIAQLTVHDGTSFISTAQEYVRLAGDVMTGFLTLSADPTDALHAVTKQFADATYINTAGDTMSGFLTLNADPTTNLHAVTKQYADNTFVDAAGDTMSGPLDMGATNKIINMADPTLAQDAVTKSYVDVAVAAVSAMFDNLFSVGSIFFGPDPNGTIPGTWTQLPVGTFLMAAGAGDVAGSTGGNNNTTLTTTQLPAHTHTGTAATAGSHRHDTHLGSGNGGGRSYIAREITRYDGLYSNYIEPGGDHSHTLSLDSAGTGAAYDSRPKYESADAWKRTA